MTMTKWYEYGNSVVGAQNAAEAMKLGGLDWKAITKALYQQTGTEKVELKDGTIREIPTFDPVPQVGNIRDTDNFVLGIVTKRYQIVQNAEAFEFTDSLIGDDIKYKTAGSVYNGIKVYLTAEMPQTKLFSNQALDAMLVFTTTHDGKGSVKVSIVPMLNGTPMNLKLKEANRQISLIHTGNMARKMEQAKETLTFAETYLQALVREAKRLSGAKVTENQLEAFLEELFIIKTNDGDRKIKSVIEAREELTKYYERTGKHKGTQWGLIQAVTEMVSDAPAKRASETFEERKFNSIVEGDSIIDKAYKILLESDRVKAEEE